MLARPSLRFLPRKCENAKFARSLFTATATSIWSSAGLRKTRKLAKLTERKRNPSGRILETSCYFSIFDLTVVDGSRLAGTEAGHPLQTAALRVNERTS